MYMISGNANGLRTCEVRCTGSGCLDTILRSGGKWQERCLTGFEG
ncbi:MAG: hypothetical protein VB124_03715 [Burkholderia sp.]